MKEGYGYEWDAMLLGGPADGCLDRTIVINGETPPKILKRIVDGGEMKRETLGEKIIEYMTNKSIDEDQRVAVYKLREALGCNEKCWYDYLETVPMSAFRDKYETTETPDT